MNPQDRPALKTITASGVYQLRLCKPKPEKFKLNAAGYPSVWIFFLDAEGNCVSKYYSVQYGKGLAMVIGKFSGKYVKTLPESSSLEQLTAYVDQAVNCIAEVDIEATENGEWQGKKQYKYKFKSVNPIVKLSQQADLNTHKEDFHKDEYQSPPF
jgi:hypothetical protein